MGVESVGPGAVERIHHQGVIGAKEKNAARMRNRFVGLAFPRLGIERPGPVDAFLIACIVGPGDVVKKRRRDPGISGWLADGRFGRPAMLPFAVAMIVLCEAVPLVKRRQSDVS